MSEDVVAASIAGLICFGCWGVIAGLLGFAAHARMVAVERADGRRALPANESALVWYAGASIAWPFAFFLAILGLAKRDWARVGRNSAFLLLGHFTVYVIGSVAISAAQGMNGGILPIVVFACVLVGLGSLVASVFSWMWSGARAARISREPSEGEPMGPARFAIYVASAAMWPAGIIAALVLNKPHDVHVGTVAFRISIATLVLIALGVCLGLPLLVAQLPL